MITCALRSHVKYVMNKNNNFMYENLCPIKCIFKLFLLL